MNRFPDLLEHAPPRIRRDIGEHMQPLMDAIASGDLERAQELAHHLEHRAAIICAVHNQNLRQRSKHIA